MLLISSNITAVFRLRHRGEILATAALVAASPLGILLGVLVFHPFSETWNRALPLALAVGSSLAAFAVLFLALRGMGATDDTAVDGELGIASRASRDRLTGLPTREAFLAAVGAALGEPGAAGVLGVVRFGDYDRLAAFDLPGADGVLLAFANRLTRSLGADRLLAQVDRDCFGVWFGREDDAKAAAAELHAVGYILGQELHNGTLEVNPRVGLAAAVHPRDGATPAELLASALATVRFGPRGNPADVAFARQSTDEAREQFRLEQALHHAIAGDQFRLHFQPVIDTDDGRVVGAEALLRWNHPDLGMIPPAAFISVLEDSSLMDEVGLWVLNTACRQTRALNAAGFGGLKMAVNVSGRQLRDGALPTMIERTLARHALDAAQLEIELTETAALENEERTLGLLTDLRRLGVSVAIDDFGTGHSSLSKLKRLPFSKLKIDREFVTGVDTDRDNQAICRSLVELAHGLGMAVLAEGAETLEEVETVRRLGCGTFQGYFFARPLPAAEFEQKLADADWLAMLASPAHREQGKLRQRMISR